MFYLDDYLNLLTLHGRGLELQMSPDGGLFLLNKASKCVEVHRLWSVGSE